MFLQRHAASLPHLASPILSLSCTSMAICPERHFSRALLRSNRSDIIVDASIAATGIPFTETLIFGSSPRHSTRYEFQSFHFQILRKSSPGTEYVSNAGFSGPMGSSVSSGDSILSPHGEPEASYSASTFQRMAWNPPGRFRRSPQATPTACGLPIPGNPSARHPSPSGRSPYRRANRASRQIPI